MPTTAPPALLPDLTDRVQLSHGQERTRISFAFGPFVLKPGRQLLLKNGAPIRIGGRSLDILAVLVERPGELISKRELVARVWPETFVEESNLKANLVGLRRILGDDPASPQYIATVVGRGYRFVADVQAHGLPAAGRGAAGDHVVHGEHRALLSLNRLRWDGDRSPTDR